MRTWPRPRWHLLVEQHVRLVIYDLQGRRIATLTDEILAAGYHFRAFDGQAMASGVYVYRLETPDGYTAEKMVLLK